MSISRYILMLSKKEDITAKSNSTGLHLDQLRPKDRSRHLNLNRLTLVFSKIGTLYRLKERSLFRSLHLKSPLPKAARNPLLESKIRKEARQWKK